MKGGCRAGRLSGRWMAGRMGPDSPRAGGVAGGPSHPSPSRHIRDVIQIYLNSQVAGRMNPVGEDSGR